MSNAWSQMKLINEITHFMYLHCTGSGAEQTQNQAKFISSMLEIFNNTKLRIRSIEELWSISWDKPIWSNEKATRASVVYKTCLTNNNFQNYQQLSTDEEFNLQSLKGLRDPVEKLARIQALHAGFSKVYDAYVKTMSELEELDRSEGIQNSQSRNFDAIRKSIGVPPHQKLTNTLYSEMHALRGYGGITELHTLADHGFPVCKPDLWIVRLAQAFTEIQQTNQLEAFIQIRYPDFKIAEVIGDEKFFERQPQFTFLVMDYLIESQLDFEDEFFATHNIPITQRYIAHRLTDLLVAKFGMSLEKSFGLIRSPLELLDKNDAKSDPRLIEHYPLLSELATKGAEIQRVAALKKKQGGTKEKAPSKRYAIKKEKPVKVLEPKPQEIDEYRSQLVSFKQALFDERIKKLMSKGATWGQILAKLQVISPANFGDSTL